MSRITGDGPRATRAIGELSGDTRYADQISSQQQQRTAHGARLGPYAEPALPLLRYSSSAKTNYELISIQIQTGPTLVVGRRGIDATGEASALEGAEDGLPISLCRCVGFRCTVAHDAGAAEPPRRRAASPSRQPHDTEQARSRSRGGEERVGGGQGRGEEFVYFFLLRRRAHTHARARQDAAIGHADIA